MIKIKQFLFHSILFMTIALNVCIAQAVEVSPIIGLGQENVTFEILEFSPDGKAVNFEPNIPGLLSLGINAFGFGVGYSFRGSREKEDLQRTQTDFSDWQLSYNSKNWGLEGYYQSYKGFETVNTTTVQKFPELYFNHIGFLARGAIGEQDQEFSLAALLNQSAHITTTSWKAYWVLGYNQIEMQNDSSLLQQENAGIDVNLENLRGLKSSIVKAGFGAGKYWVSENKLFVGGLFDMLITHANNTYDSTTGGSSKSKTSIHPLAGLNFRLALGYAGSPFRTGLSMSSNTSALESPGNGIFRTFSNRFQFYVRYAADF